MTIAKDNVVIGNRIDSFMVHLKDGGGIYFLGPQPSSKIERNYLLDGGNGNGLYPDEGTGFTTWSGNVVDEDRPLVIRVDAVDPRQQLCR